jgi:hypothetical protein
MFDRADEGGGHGLFDNTHIRKEMDKYVTKAYLAVQRGEPFFLSVGEVFERILKESEMKKTFAQDFTAAAGVKLRTKQMIQEAERERIRAVNRNILQAKALGSNLDLNDVKL